MLLLNLLLEARPVTAQQPTGFAAVLPQIVMIVLIIAIFWFLIIQPQRKRAKQHQMMLDNLKKGDRVVTNGGIIGRIDFIGDKTTKLEISDKVKIEILRGQIAGLYEEGESKKEEKKEENK